MMNPRLLQLVTLLAVFSLAPNPVSGANPPGVPTIEGLDSAGKAPVVAGDWLPQLIPNPQGTANHDHITINGISHVYQNKKAWAITADDAEKQNSSWSRPRHIADGVMINKPMVPSLGKSRHTNSQCLELTNR